ncbi:alpha/beta fold hydrolase [Modestobacter sp. I12A-02628]|uniref:Alpha/beta hydrolase n=1 Tax=Goekera deserti TaxID=2497753 RepID=A0A7K3WAN0_9ACTN|nr:alpha/beta hydrolase [Goekera deserti]MPQ98765.1 alpha/beta fold hydrolase [Goekera deserti]NDI49738.1 alpha/beta fold hydrolase [Goekera deserti]NEL53069.1 alpha/beta hydrolase [Goekera deserti]
MTAATFPALTALGLAGSLGAGLVHHAYASVRHLADHPGFERHERRCGSGNLVSYHVRRGRPGGGTVVCEAGLMNTSSAWLLVADHVDAGTTVVLVDRAGYRRSLRRCPERYCFQESVGDLAEVVAEASDPAGTTVLAGHSMGGYLAHRTAAGMPGRVHGVVLVDPTHPRELHHSMAQRSGSRGMDLTLRLGPGSAVLGCGLLLDKRNLFAYAADNPHRRALRLEVSASSTWRAARREWAYAYAFMVDGGRELQQLDVPVVVAAAESTLQGTPEHRDLYDEYVASGSGGHVRTVPGSDHLSILGAAAPAAATAAEITALLDRASRARRPLTPVGGRS